MTQSRAKENRQKIYRRNKDDEKVEKKVARSESDETRDWPLLVNRPIDERFDIDISIMQRSEYILWPLNSSKSVAHTQFKVHNNK